MKGNIEEELKISKKAIEQLNYKLEKIEKFKLPIELSDRNIIVLKKISKTDKIYPREFSKIKKKPL